MKTVTNDEKDYALPLDAGEYPVAVNHPLAMRGAQGVREVDAVLQSLSTGNGAFFRRSASDWPSRNSITRNSEPSSRPMSYSVQIWG